jgi:cell division protein FtsW
MSVAERPIAERRHLALVEPVPARSAAAIARTDLWLLLTAAVLLTLFGLVMVLSAGSVSAAQGYGGNSFWYFQRQVMYAAGGLGAMLIAWRMSYRAWAALAIPLLVGSALLMILAVVHPSRSCLYGACRWIDLGPITLQPSEFAKLGLVAFTAAVLTRKRRHLHDPMHLLIPLAPVVAVIAGLVLLQQDLGTTVIICGTVFLLMFVAGVRMRYLAVTGLAGLLVGGLMIFSEPYRRSRLLGSWLNAEADPLDSGLQLIQSLVAIGSGGFTGVGLGGSRAKWDFLPNAHSDFIFAVIGEELGIVGATGVLIAFALLLYAGVRIAIHAKDAFGRLLAAGIVSWLGLQTIINLGAVTGVLPITGVPLPFLSFGGSALVVTLLGVGVLASVARARVRPLARGTPRPSSHVLTPRSTAAAATSRGTDR